MAPPTPYMNPFGYSSASSNPFLQSMAQPPFSTGRPLGVGLGGGGMNISGLVGVTDPMMQLTLNSLLSQVLTSSLGNNFIPAQYSPSSNLYSQMSARNVMGDFRSTVGQASQRDQELLYRYARGAARITGSEFGPREQESARKFAAMGSSFLPYLPSGALDAIGGSTGTATAMAQNMFLGARYATDPITGKRGLSADSVSAVTDRVFENLYGQGKDISRMGGVTAGQAGSLYDEMQRRGLMGGAAPRSQSMQKIAKNMNMTIAEASAMPDVDTKIRELDADRISDKLKDMSKAVSAMKEIFGEMGQPDAPMQQLVGAIEALTQANIPSTDPAKMERMIRDTSNTAKAAGIDMPQMFKIMGSTAAMSDRAGVDRIFTPGITNQAVLENEASKRIFGGAKAFGMASSDKLMNISQQLGVESTKDPRTQQLAAITRLVDQYKFEPEKGSELANVYDILTGKKEATAEEKRNLINISQRPGGMAEFLKSQKVSSSVIQDLVSNPAANAEYMHKYDIGNKFGREMQAERVTRDMAGTSRYVVERYAKDPTGGASDGLKKELTENSKDISYIASSALMNASKEELDKPEEVVKKALETHLKSKGLTNLSDKDQQLINSMSSGLADNAKSYAKRAGFEYLSNMQTTMSPAILREAAISRAQVSQESQFQETLRGIGKTDVTQRVADLIKNAGPHTTLSEGIASILGAQNKDVVANLLGEDVEKLDKASKLYANFDVDALKDEYLRNAAIENQINISEPNNRPEDKAKFEAQKKEIKDQIKKAGYGKTEEELEQKYKEFADYSKNKEFSADTTPSSALDRASSNLKNFEAKNFISLSDLKKLDKQQAGIVGRGNALREIKNITSKSGFAILDQYGNAVPGNTQYSDLNDAYNDLNSTNNKDIKFGLDSMSSFIDAYMGSEKMLEKGGEAGADLVGRGKKTKSVIDKMLASFGGSVEDLMSGNIPEAAFNTEYLKKIREEDVNFTKELLDDKKAPTARANIETNIKTLKEEITKNPNFKGRNEARIKELEALRDAKKDDIVAKKEYSDKVVKELANDPAKAIADEYQKFETARNEKNSADTALDKLITQIEKTKKIGLSSGNVEKYLDKGIGEKDTKELIGLGDDKAKLSDKDDKRKKQILKASGAANVAEYEKADKLRAMGAEKFNELTKLVDQGDKITTNDKSKKDRLLKDADIKTDDEFKKLSKIKLDSKETEELLGLKRSNLTPEQKARKEELLKKGNRSNIDEFEKSEEARKLIQSKLTDGEKANLEAANKAKKAADEKVEKAVEFVSKFTPEVLKSALSGDKVKNLMGSAVGTAKELLAGISRQITDPRGAAISEERKKDIVKANSLQTSPKALAAYLRETGLDNAAKGTDIKAAGLVAGKISAAASEAARAGGLGAKATDEDKAKALRDLFYKPEDKLTDKEKEAKEKATQLGVKKDWFNEKGEVFSTSGMKKQFSETSRKLSDGSLLESKDKKNTVVTLDKNTEFVVKGNIKLNGDANLTMAGGSNTDTRST